MPRFQIEALEKFLVRTVYTVEAESSQQAEALCRSGDVAYDQKTIKEGDEEWVETLAVTQIDSV